MRDRHAARNFCLALLLLAVPAAAKDYAKFHGTGAGQATTAGSSVTAMGQGSAPHWGAYTEQLSWSGSAGTFTVDFGGGDQLYGTATFFVPPGPEDRQAWLTITGGTGPFVGASGWLSWYAEFDQTGGPPGPYSAVLYGYLSWPGPGK